MTIHLSTADGQWSVLVNQQPICAHTDEATARTLFAKTSQRFPEAVRKFWNGDTATESDLK